jgi:RNA-directed DNA polymerase
MKRIKHVWKKIIDPENIRTAIIRASEKKRERPAVQRVLSDIDRHVQIVHDLLKEDRYVPSPYVEVVIRDGCSQKERIIHKPKFFPDQIIHWALALPVQDQWKNSLYQYACGSIPGRGLHMGATAVKRWMKNDEKNTKYCYKIDISKYYPSIDQNVLMGQFSKMFHEPEVVNLIGKIVGSHSKGLPIGNFTSQWFANLYLKDFDWWAKQELRVPYYMRYIDDIVFFHRNKKELHNIRAQVEKRLLSVYRLKIKPNWQIFKVDGRGVDFLGYRFFHGMTIIRKRTAFRLTRRMRSIGKKDAPTLGDASAVMSYMGITAHCNSKMFVDRFILPYISIAHMKEVHRENSSLIVRTAGVA